MKPRIPHLLTRRKNTVIKNRVLVLACVSVCVWYLIEQPKHLAGPSRPRLSHDEPQKLVCACGHSTPKHTKAKHHQQHKHTQKPPYPPQPQHTHTRPPLIKEAHGRLMSRHWPCARHLCKPSPPTLTPTHHINTLFDGLQCTQDQPVLRHLSQGLTRLVYLQL